MKRTWMFALFSAIIAYPVFCEEVIATRIAGDQTTVFFQKTLPQFTSALSDDKRTLTLHFQSLDVPDSLRYSLGKGVVKEAYWQISGKSAKLFLRFEEKRGYTIAKQPFSHSLAIEVFNWSQLSAAEDAYRRGLLAEESCVDSTANDLYNQAFNNCVAAAAMRIGIIAAVSGNTGDADEWFEKARQNGLRSPELTAASAYIARAKGDMRGAEFLADLFAKQTSQRLIFDKIGDFSPPNTEILSGEPIPLTASFDETAEPIQQNKKLSETDLNQRFASLFSEKKTESPNMAISSQSSFLPSWVKTGSLAFAAFFCTGGFYIGFMYFRWRKGHRQYRKKSQISNPPSHEKGADFADELHNAAMAQSASRAYSPQAIDFSIDDSIPEEAEQIILPQKESKIVEHSVLPKVPLAKRQSIEQLFDSEPHSEIEALAGIFPPGEIKLAMRLHSQRRTHKNETLQTLSGNEVPAGHYRLSQTARALGVEQNGLELKKMLADDSAQIARLYKKFGAQAN